MKVNFNKKYVSIGIIAFLVIICSILFFLFCFQMDKFTNFLDKIFKVLNPVIWGLVIAYLFTPLVNFFERRIFFPLKLRKNDCISVKWKKAFRIFSIILTYLLIGGLIALFIYSVFPEVITSVQRISVQLPNYISSLQKWLNDLYASNLEWVKPIEELLSVNSTGSMLFQTFLSSVSSVFSGFYEGLIDAITGVWNLIIGLIISIYVLLNKELFSSQAKKITYSLFSKSRANLLLKDTRFVSDTFSGFLVGKLVDSLIIGILCFIGCTILRLPYAVLVSVIVGVTNIIPFFGPFIGAIPSALLILMIDPWACLKFVIFVLLLQQLDGNVIGPKILGESTGLSGFWVIFSLTIFGGLWNVIGMIIGIPFFAVVYAMIKRNVERRLKAKELPVDTNAYRPIKRIDEDGSIVELLEADEKNFKFIPKTSVSKSQRKKKINQILHKKVENQDEFINDSDSDYQADIKERMEAKAHKEEKQKTEESNN